MDVEDWNERYGADALPYGTAPNDFVAEQGGLIPPGPVLCLAEGYGRNALWLAARGHAVTAMEQSPVAVARGRALAAERGVTVTFVQADLADFEMGEERWSGIVSTYAHVPPALRRDVHARAVRALAPGGVFILEAYSPAQLGHSTGGPKEVELLMSATDLRSELPGLELLVAHDVERLVHEGPKHTGMAAVVQVAGRKPA